MAASRLGWLDVPKPIGGTAARARGLYADEVDATGAVEDGAVAMEAGPEKNDISALIGAAGIGLEDVDEVTFGMGGRLFRVGLFTAEETTLAVPAFAPSSSLRFFWTARLSWIILDFE